MNQVLDGGISEIKRKVCFQLIEHSCSRAIAEYWRHQNNLAVYTINRECNCKRQNVMEISGRTSIFIDVKPFMRSWKPGVGKNQPPNHHHSDGHYWFCPKLTRVLVSLGKFFPLFKDRILGKIFWNIPGNLSANKMDLFIVQFAMLHQPDQCSAGTYKTNLRICLEYMTKAFFFLLRKIGNIFDLKQSISDFHLITPLYNHWFLRRKYLFSNWGILCLIVVLAFLYVISDELVCLTMC